MASTFYENVDGCNGKLDFLMTNPSTNQHAVDSRYDHRDILPPKLIRGKIDVNHLGIEGGVA